MLCWSSLLTVFVSKDYEWDQSQRRRERSFYDRHRWHALLHFMWRFHLQILTNKLLQRPDRGLSSLFVSKDSLTTFPLSFSLVHHPPSQRWDTPLLFTNLWLHDRRCVELMASVSSSLWNSSSWRPCFWICMPCRIHIKPLWLSPPLFRSLAV